MVLEKCPNGHGSAQKNSIIKWNGLYRIVLPKKCAKRRYSKAGTPFSLFPRIDSGTV